MNAPSHDGLHENESSVSFGRRLEDQNWVTTVGDKFNSTEGNFRAKQITESSLSNWNVPFSDQIRRTMAQVSQYTSQGSWNGTFAVTETVMSQSPTDYLEPNGSMLNATSATPANASSSSQGTDLLRWVHIPAYAVILCLAVVGNVLVIGTLAPRLLPRFPSRLSWKTTASSSSGGNAVEGSSWRVRSLTNVFLLNLAVADLLLGLLCVPFTLVGAILRDFVFGSAMCKLIPYLQGM
ncbi:hypothetical protein J437_LFUL010098 [Ladona fulva]|uniref:G-protein coupled receptors family 1 profile domain-containing protein n=1 Tax=Ladona fulva TaxID=123851 RepID=A0A8K0K9Z7_LADFU|nr:hypothetical protein J437_LFUL010098 [Ladona fulva]